ncbi:acetyl-CoA acetyltransferase [Candidatus Peregrinibacteria bacterium CG10_big_fil_rev_8_21_14_0_10_49_16]|nr:MAG: acetyl-CoA acetyltransferase [Candidatus Peregrinibacteria bacterium CG10_big_fil_rev_8_21_14_0_10_49_16]
MSPTANILSWYNLTSNLYYRYQSSELTHVQRDIFLIGSGQTRFGEWWHMSLQDLVQKAMDTSIENAPCTALDIDMVITANMLGELTNNQAHVGALASALLPHKPPALRIEAACASGSVALHTACAFLESERAETILVLGVEKMTDVSSEQITRALMGASDNEKDQVPGLTFPGIFGLIAKRYMYEYGLKREELNIVSARHHENASKNPNAQFRSPIAPESVETSPLVADPLHMLDCSPISDGAAACILSTKYKSPFQLRASTLANDAVSITDRESITSFSATKEALEKALKEACIRREDIATIEHHDCFSIAAVINMEDLGFADKGKGIECYTKPSSHTFNASGGLKACGHPVGATGIKQLIDVRKQLEHSQSRYGLAHNFGGACATCCVHILEYTV